MEYKVIKEQYAIHIEKQVNEHLDKGWRLQGGVSVSQGFFSQALVRE